jgi:8-oxo-dGTP pyrophosphatase MutT (NUDIX family)
MSELRNFFTIDMEDYDEDDEVLVQPAARGIIWKDGRLALVRSVKYGYCKFPGGGVDEGESLTDALIREVREEAGLEVIPESIRPFGMSKRREKGIWKHVLDQDSYYYLCDVTDRILPQELGKHEKEAKFVLDYLGPHEAIEANEAYLRKDPKVAIDRDNRILRILAAEQDSLT